MKRDLRPVSALVALGAVVLLFAYCGAQRPPASTAEARPSAKTRPAPAAPDLLVAPGRTVRCGDAVCGPDEDCCSGPATKPVCVGKDATCPVRTIRELCDEAADCPDGKLCCVDLPWASCQPTCSDPGNQRCTTDAECSSGRCGKSHTCLVVTHGAGLRAPGGTIPPLRASDYARMNGGVRPGGRRGDGGLR